MRRNYRGGEMPVSHSKTRKANRVVNARAKAMRDRLRADAPDAAPLISPLAPSSFPVLPAIDGVRFAAVAAGVKYAGRTDVMLAEIARGSSIAGVFTKSSTRSAPVLQCQANLAALSEANEPDGPFGILVNSGNANAFTGARGEAAVEETTAKAAKVLGTGIGCIFPASTGVIGEPLPARKVTAVLGQLADQLSPSAAEEAARAIMTTDTFAKGATASVMLGGKTVQIVGIAKGSGMIAPDMATMLAYVFTDAAIDRAALQDMLSTGTETTFNAITVDSDTSTSDTLMVAATGKAGNRRITSSTGAAGKAFASALTQVLRDLAHQVVRDGEGATKFIEITVSGGASDASAAIIGRAIANSPLVKTAIAGEDPNWGRVVMAIGKSGEPADRDAISIRFGDVLVADKGWVSPDYREADGVAHMKGQNISIAVDLGIGNGRATVWTCDLTHQYIAINADYRS